MDSLWRISKSEKGAEKDMYKEMDKQFRPEKNKRYKAKVMTPQDGAEKTKEIKQKLIKDNKDKR